jgi:hypothetical protein
MVVMELQTLSLALLYSTPLVGVVVVMERLQLLLEALVLVVTALVMVIQQVHLLQIQVLVVVALVVMERLMVLQQPVQTEL